MRLFLVAMLATLSSAATAQERYENARFNYSFDVPANFRMAEIALNGDGAIYVDDTTGVELFLYGAHDIAGGLSADRDLSLGFRADEGDEITYAPQGENWYVLSGFRAAGDIFYSYTAFDRSCDGADITVSYVIDYPTETRSIYEPLLAPLNESLRLGLCD